MTAAKQREIQFQIQQLRMDELIYPVGAIAVCFAVFLVLLSLPVLYTYLPRLPQQTPLALLAVAVGSVILALLGNFIRCLKLRRLQKELVS